MSYPLEPDLYQEPPLYPETAGELMAYLSTVDPHTPIKIYESVAWPSERVEVYKEDGVIFFN